jgi:hypothetical protein
LPGCLLPGLAAGEVRTHAPPPLPLTNPSPYRAHLQQVHWFSIVNSTLVILVMAVICALILIRTIRRDLSHYEQLVVDTNNLDMKDEAGWKLVAGDVFRAPADSRGLAVQVLPPLPAAS